MIYSDIENLIGNTPLLKIRSSSHGLKNIDVYAKLEYLNPFGSIKDRTAVGLTSGIDFEGLAKRGGGVIESSSGNTAKALQVISARRGVQFTSVTDRVKVPEVEQLLRYLGASIISIPGASECPDPNDKNNAPAIIEQMVTAKPDHYVHTKQYTNQANPAIHSQTTAQEIFDDLARVDYIGAGIGTGGSSSGLIDYIDNHKQATKLIGIVSDPSDFLPGIRTISDLYATSLFDRRRFSAIEEVNSQKALEVLDRLVRNDGILAGPTTGGCFAGLINYLRDRDSLASDGSRQVAVFVACDRLESYMSYMVKRLPERFNRSTYTDIFSASSDATSAAVEKPADQATFDWAQQAGVLVIDTRAVKAYTAFHIEGSISYPESLLREVLEIETPFDVSRPILLVCPKGDRSALLCSALRARGYDAYSLAGGLLSWRAEKLPFIRKTVPQINLHG